MNQVLKQVLKRVLIVFLAVGLLISVWVLGYNKGMSHVVYDSEIFITELPEAGDDRFTVYLEIDGQVHEYDGSIG